MDMLDRIAALLRTLFGDAGSAERPAGPGARPPRPSDPDLAAAWDELNDYLGEDASEGGTRSGPREGSWRAESARGGARAGSPPESLRADYANLEVPFGADGEAVRRSYKRLVLRYHPDRHGGDPEKVRVATEITKKVNESFERIRAFQERRAGER
jgi:DnaJ-domain-containing protein 1